MNHSSSGAERQSSSKNPGRIQRLQSPQGKGASSSCLGMSFSSFFFEKNFPLWWRNCSLHTRKFSKNMSLPMRAGCFQKFLKVQGFLKFQIFCELQKSLSYNEKNELQLLGSNTKCFMNRAKQIFSQNGFEMEPREKYSKLETESHWMILIPKIQRRHRTRLQRESRLDTKASRHGKVSKRRQVSWTYFSHRSLANIINTAFSAQFQIV